MVARRRVGRVLGLEIGANACTDLLRALDRPSRGGLAESKKAGEEIGRLAGFDYLGTEARWAGRPTSAETAVVEGTEKRRSHKDRPR